MTDVPPRCPFCANVIKVESTFWSRIGLKTALAYCMPCQRSFEARDAQTMGSSFHQWAELFRGKLAQALNLAPILPEPVLHRALGNPHKDDTRLIPSLDELVRTCLRHQRTPLIEMARGRESTLEVTHLHNEATGDVEVVAILGTSSSESGSREWEQLVARTGLSHFVLYTHPGTSGAETRVKRAVHQRPLPAPQHDPAVAARMQASRAPAAVPHTAKHR